MMIDLEDLEDLALDCVEDIVEASGYLFHRVETSKFFGIHAYIEINLETSHHMIAAHIRCADLISKSEDSIYKVDIKEYYKHLNNLDFPVIFIVMEQEGKGYWADLKDSFRDQSDNEYTEIKILSCIDNVFSFNTFNTIIVDYFIGNSLEYLIVRKFLGNSKHKIFATLIKSMTRIADLAIASLVESQTFLEFTEKIGFEVLIRDNYMDLVKSKNLIHVQLVNKAMWFMTESKDSEGEAAVFMPVISVIFFTEEFNRMKILSSLNIREENYNYFWSFQDIII